MKAGTAVTVLSLPGFWMCLAITLAPGVNRPRTHDRAISDPSQEQSGSGVPERGGHDIAWVGVTTTRFAYDGAGPVWLSVGYLAFSGPGSSDVLAVPQSPDGGGRPGGLCISDASNVWVGRVDGDRQFRMLARSARATEAVFTRAGVVTAPLWVSGGEAPVRCLDAEGSKLKSLVIAMPQPSVKVTEVVPSPSLEHVAFIAAGRLRVLRWDAERAPCSAASDVGPADLATVLCWSPDGSHVAWSFRDTLYVYTVAEGDLTRIRCEGYRLHLTRSCRSWSADCKWLAAVARRPSFEPENSPGTLCCGDYLGIAVVDVAARTVSFLTGPSAAQEYSPAWSTRGRRLALLDATTAVRILDMEAGTDLRLRRASAVAIHSIPWEEQSLAWMPGDRAIAVAVPFDGIYLLEDIPPGPPLGTG
jgi:hypothetical protein